MRQVRFVKMSGAGNTFVLIDNRRNLISRRAAIARRLCDRYEGIGADGLLLLERSRPGAYLMQYYNADGSGGGMCGNGARCIAWYAYLHGIARKTHLLEALGRLYEARIDRREVVRISFPEPGPLHTAWRTSVKQPGLPDPAYIDTGSPHAVYRVRRGSLEACTVGETGRRVRYDRSFKPSGTNVNFIEIERPNAIRIRTYERGVEAETRACGTGSIASVLAGSELWGLRSPVSVQAPGGRLKVFFKKNGRVFSGIQLQGTARIIYGGSIRV